MKVVLFCGGLGTRMREHSTTIPKPLVTVGDRPILWLLMKYYAHYGHKDFIICLGYRGEMIKDFFLNYNPYLHQDFSIERGGKVFPDASDIADWRITFVDTGMHSNIGERLMKVRPYLEGEEVFLANYSDQLTDLPLPAHIEACRERDAIAGFLAVRPSQSFHCISFDGQGMVDGIMPVRESDMWVNGGYMVLRNEIFDYMKDGEELVEKPFGRVQAKRKLYAHRYEGFWGAMDTFKEKIMFDRMDAQGERPWHVWDTPFMNGSDGGAGISTDKNAHRSDTAGSDGNGVATPARQRVPQYQC